MILTKQSKSFRFVHQFANQPLSLSMLWIRIKKNHSSAAIIRGHTRDQICKFIPKNTISNLPWMAVGYNFMDVNSSCASTGSERP